MAPDANLHRLHEGDVSIWLDTLSRQLLQSGEFTALIRDFSVTGATSNPTIFAKAITGSDLYDDQLRSLASEGQRDPQELFFALALDDVRRAARELRPTYDESDGRDGFISFECTPDLADDTNATIAQSLRPVAAPRSTQRDDQGPRHQSRPARDRGAHAPRRERQHHTAVRNRPLRAGDRRLLARPDLTRPSRRAAQGDRVGCLVLPLPDRHEGRRPAPRIIAAVWTRRDRQRPQRPQRYLAKFAGPEWDRLKALGARTQRPLWASTGTKNPVYPDVLYVSELVGPSVINTMPEETLRAFADHGEVGRTLDINPANAQRTLADAAPAGIDLQTVTAALEREGVQSFCDSYHQLIGCIESKLSALASPASPRAR